MKNLNPLTTLTITLCMIVTVFFQQPLYAMCLFILILLFVIKCGTMKVFLKSLVRVVFLISMIFFMQSCLVVSKSVLWQFGFLHIYEEGFIRAINLSSKLIIIASSFFWFFSITPIKNLVIVLKQKNMSNTSAYVILSTFQMISLMSKKSKVIMDAQRSRGLETEGNLFIRAKAFFPSLAPLIVSSLLSAEERALTLEARGFSANVRKTSTISIDDTKLDKYIRITSIAIAIIIILEGVYAWIK